MMEKLARSERRTSKYDPRRKSPSGLESIGANPPEGQFRRKRILSSIRTGGKRTTRPSKGKRIPVKITRGGTSLARRRRPRWVRAQETKPLTATGGTKRANCRKGNPVADKSEEKGEGEGRKSAEKSIPIRNISAIVAEKMRMDLREEGGDVGGGKREEGSLSSLF